MRALAVLVALACGCSVDVGAGSIPPVAIDAPVDDSSAPPVSMPMEVEFLSADDSQAMESQYGDKLGAVTAIDLSVQALDVLDERNNPVAGGVLTVTFDGVTLKKVGDRVRLPDALKKQMISAIRSGSALDIDVQATVDWSPPPPSPMDAHAVVQPIFVVDGLKAL